VIKFQKHWLINWQHYVDPWDQKVEWIEGLQLKCSQESQIQVVDSFLEASNMCGDVATGGESLGQSPEP
jgi:hypothetical protein